MFQWMESLAPGIVAHAVLAIRIVAAVGLGLGSLGFRGIRLGAAGVLFVGIFFGQLGMHIDERILEFVRDFGLILFVYTIGLQVGPSFFSSLRRQGLQLNGLVAAVVLLGGSRNSSSGEAGTCWRSADCGSGAEPNRQGRSPDLV